MCVRSPTAAPQVYGEKNETSNCGDPLTVDLSCHATPPVAPPTPATVILEGFVDTFGLEKATTGVTVEVKTPDGTTIGAPVLSDANHRCARVKTLGNKTVTLSGYSIPNVPTNSLLVIKNTGSGFRNSHIFGKFFSTAKCQSPPTYNDDACHEGCFTRNGTVIFRYDTNIISDQSWNLIPLTAGYSRGIAPGNAAIAGQIHDCNDNRLRNAAVAFSTSARAKVLTYFNGNCEDPSANNVESYTNKNSLYAILDAAPGRIKMNAEVLNGVSLQNLGVYDLELFPNSVSLLTLGPPVPRVAGQDGGP
jgi:hypothetical protein